MAEKRSVTVPLTARQKDQIKRATGKSISALKVAPSGGVMVAGTRAMIVGKSLVSRKLARAMTARNLARKSLARNIV